MTALSLLRHNEHVNFRRRKPDFDPVPSAPEPLGDPLAALSSLVAENAHPDLGTAALIIAASHYPGLDIASYSAQMDRIAAEAKRRIGRTRRPDRALPILNAYLFTELGFQGNADSYYDPANSFLNEVLDRRLGLPLTLSILYISVARRLGLPIVGVGMPYHFLVKYVGARKELFLDPFHGGVFLTPEDCHQRMEQVAGHEVRFDPAYLDETPARLILYRLLNNLKQIYLQREEPARAGLVVDQMLAVLPTSRQDMLDRGILYLQENALAKGALWLQNYLVQYPDADNADVIREAIARAYHQRARRN